MKTKTINLLIVDDEDALLESIRRRLQIRGFNVIAVNRGEKALEAARAQPLDIAVIDLKMPGMSGKELLVELKKEYPHLEVIIFTGHGVFDPHNKKEFGKAFTSLFKPCDLDILISTLAAAYKKTVMNRYGITPEDMDAWLQVHSTESIWEILNKIKTIDENKQQTQT